jgi:two-component system phosphate regulon sensor histidine kinase PhoR
MRIGIHWKFVFVFFVIIVLILLVVAIYLNRTLKPDYMSRTTAQLSREADLAKRYLLDIIEDHPLTYDIDTLANQMGQSLNLRVTILDPSGTVRGDSELDDQDLFNMENHANRHEVLEALEKDLGISIRFSYTLNAQMMYLAKPVVKDGNRLGIIRLAIPLTEIDQTLSSVRSLLIVSLMIGIVLALLLSYLAARAVTRPLKDMSHIAERMARGDFSRKTRTKSRDEIGQLAHTLNQMSTQLDRTITEITMERDRLRGVLGGMREGVMVTDPDGHIIMINEAFRNFFHITSSIEGKTVIETIRDACLHGAIEKTLKENKEVIEEIELTLHSQRFLYVHVVPLGLPEASTGTVTVLYDVTQIKSLEKVRKDFIANVSHELNTPLAAIKGYAETLQDRALVDIEKTQKFLDIICKHVDRMSKLVSDLLSLSRLESDTYAPSFSSQQLIDSINISIETLKDAIEKKNVTVSVDVPPDLSSVEVDEKGLVQVILNLLDNAIKFTPDNGTVSIIGREEDDFVKVAVSDTGIGIPMKDIPRIFERFYRVDKDRSRELGGTGLGLSIVKHIIQAHGGKIWVESQIGQGSTFFFLLPKA